MDSYLVSFLVTFTTVHLIKCMMPAGVGWGSCSFIQMIFACTWIISLLGDGYDAIVSTVVN